MKLGDAVHFVAQPVAKTIDLVFKTNLQHCSACAKRREFLNNIMSINSIPVHSNQTKTPSKEPNLKAIGTGMEKVQEVIDEENKKENSEAK